MATEQDAGRVTAEYLLGNVFLWSFIHSLSQHDARHAGWRGVAAAGAQVRFSSSLSII
jgi:hypothetical protein